MSYIKKIRIKNFKSLEDITVDIKPLTFLFGPNSSGKSSFLKALMFLQKNLFSYDKSETIYKISDNIDLISYQDIVSNGDIKKEITFDIEMNGQFDFPVKELFYYDNTNNEIGEIYHKGIFKYIRNVKEILWNNYQQSSCQINPEKYFLEKFNIHNIDSFMSKQEFNIRITIKFRYSKYNHLSLIKIEDVTNKSFLCFNLSKRCNEYGFKLHLFNNKMLTNIFKDYFLRNYSEEDPLNDFFRPFYNFDNIPEFPPAQHFLEKLKITYSYWQKLKQEEKLNKYFNIIKFYYLSYAFVPMSLDSNLNLFHFPITREVPQYKYLRINNKFESKEYYGLLNLLSKEQTNLNDRMKTVLKRKNNYEYSLNELYSDIKRLVDRKRVIDKKGISNINKLYPKQKEINEDLKDTYVNDPFGRISNNLIFRINYLLNKILEFDFFIIFEQNNDIGSIALIKRNLKKSFNFSNTSSGFIQILPIVILCSIIRNNLPLFLDYWFSKFYEGIRGTNKIFMLLIEQPELHLHPKLQSKLAELLQYSFSINSIIIIETHSEHLIRKIQVLIARGDLDKEKVGVFYFDNTSGKTKIKEMKIDDNGLFKEDWPDGFFDDSIDITLELYEALRKGKN